jgi:hypothetical protein
MKMVIEFSPCLCSLFRCDYSLFWSHASETDSARESSVRRKPWAAGGLAGNPAIRRGESILLPLLVRAGGRNKAR